MSAHSWERPLGSDADEGPPARRARHAWERIDDDDIDDHEAVPPLSEGDDDGDGPWGTYSDSEDGGHNTGEDNSSISKNDGFDSDEGKEDEDGGEQADAMSATSSTASRGTYVADGHNEQHVLATAVMALGFCQCSLAGAQPLARHGHTP